MSSTPGRARSIAYVTPRKIHSSPVIAVTTIHDSYQRPSWARRAIATTTVMAMQVYVSAMPLPIALRLSNKVVRCDASHTSVSASQRMQPFFSVSTMNRPMR